MLQSMGHEELSTNQRPNNNKANERLSQKMNGYKIQEYQRLSGDEFEQTLGDCEGQGSLAYCSTWDLNQLSNYSLQSTY